MVLRLPDSWSNWNLEVLAEREGRARRPHIKGVGSQRELPTINWYGWVLNGSFGKEQCATEAFKPWPFSKQDTLFYFPGARFSKVSIVFRVRKLSAFMFIVFAFKIKLLIILKMTQWNYQLRKQNWPVCELHCRLTVLLYIQYSISKFLFGPEKLPGLSRNKRLIRMVCIQGKTSFQTNIMELDSFWEKRMLVHKCRPLIGSLHPLLKVSGPKWHPVQEAK